MVSFPKFIVHYTDNRWFISDGWPKWGISISSDKNTFTTISAERGYNLLKSDRYYCQKDKDDWIGYYYSIYERKKPKGDRNFLNV